jgi:transposase
MKKHLVNLAPSERADVERFVRTGHRSAQAITRARILLLADQQGQQRNDAEIARTLGVNLHTIENIRRRYAQHGLKAVLERKPRSDQGRPVKVDGRVEAQLITLACSETPHGEPSWTLQMLGDALVQSGLVETISRETVCQTLKKTRSGHI